MSNKRQTIEIAPPHNGTMVEGIYSSGHVCPYCNGAGWHWGDPLKQGGDAKEPCTVCEGSGELDAMVTIEWVPRQDKN